MYMKCTNSQWKFLKLVAFTGAYDSRITKKLIGSRTAIKFQMLLLKIQYLKGV